jgi:hypothetical protein
MWYGVSTYLGTPFSGESVVELVTAGEHEKKPQGIPYARAQSLIYMQCNSVGEKLDNT